MKKYLFKLILLLVMLGGNMFIPAISWSENIAVIVNTENSSNISRDDIRFIYKGQLKAYANGIEVVPLDQKDGSKVRKVFLNKAVGKTNGQYKRFWTRKIFAGKGVSPKVIKGGDNKVKERVVGNRSAIGYISESSVDKSVRVVSIFKTKGV